MSQSDAQTSISLDKTIEHLLTDVAALIEAHASGISEHELLCLLREQHPGYQALFDTQGELGLFRSHFLLMHILYRLRESWQQQHKADLQIQALNIRRWPFRDLHGESLPAEEDKLASYYLDFSHYHDTSAEDVRALLNQFWEKYLAQDEKQAALTELELCEPIGLADARQQYKRLAMQHHPDRGGCAERFKRLSKAMEVLNICLKE